MKKTASLILVLCLLLLSLTACSPSSSNSGSNGTSPNPSDSSDNADADYKPQLSEDFYEKMVLFMLDAGSVNVNDLQLTDGSEFFSPLWHFVYFDSYAAEDGHPSKYNLAQYKNNTVMYDRYDIPADIYVQAMKSWYGYDFDIATLHILTESELESAVPVQPRVAYNPDSDVVYVTIDGIGSDFFSQVENVELSSEGREVTATVSLSSISVDNDGQSSEPEPAGSYIITIRENEDQTFTIISITYDAL